MNESFGLVRTVVWRRLDLPGAEYCTFRHDGAERRIEGSVVLVLDGIPLRVAYEVSCSEVWETERVSVNLSAPGRKEKLELTVDTEKRWWLPGEELADLRGCIDIDLGVTPSTNTLPVCRLSLAVGESQEVSAAWVRFPDMQVLRFPQRYTRIGKTTYRYESNSGGFVAEIEVDPSGIVTYYPGGWECSALV